MTRGLANTAGIGAGGGRVEGAIYKAIRYTRWERKVIAITR
jgi:hypothetical protein